MFKLSFLFSIYYFITYYYNGNCSYILDMNIKLAIIGHLTILFADDVTGDESAPYMYQIFSLPYSCLIRGSFGKTFGKNNIHGLVIMPPTSKKLRRHIGLGLSVRVSVRPSVRPSMCYACTRSRIDRDRTLKFGMWGEYEN